VKWKSLLAGKLYPGLGEPKLIEISLKKSVVESPKATETSKLLKISSLSIYVTLLDITS